MKTSDFDYTLPPELIAQTPIEPRDAARLLVLDRATGAITHRVFSEILDYLCPGDLLIGNNSRVIPARLHGVKQTGGMVEIFLLRTVLTPPGPPSPERSAGSGEGEKEKVGMPGGRQGAAAGGAGDDRP